jgi:hypothetical protein
MMTADDGSTLPRSQNVPLQGVQANLTCYGFHVYAEDFLAAARAYAPGARTGSFVAHFLCCQSVELSLKAFLSLKGMTRQQLRKEMGHNLSKLFDAACGQRIGDFVAVDPAADASTLQKATDWYDTPRGKRFQYFDLVDAMLGFRHAPDFAELEGLATRLQSGTLRTAVQNA